MKSILLILNLLLFVSAYSQDIDLTQYDLSKEKKIKLPGLHNFNKVAKYDLKGYTFYFDYNFFIQSLSPFALHGDTTAKYELRKIDNTKDTIYLNPFVTKTKVIDHICGYIGNLVINHYMNFEKTGSGKYEQVLITQKYLSKNKTRCLYKGVFYFSQDKVLLANKVEGVYNQRPQK